MDKDLSHTSVIPLFCSHLFIRKLILFENLFKPRQLHLAVLKYSLRLAS